LRSDASATLCDADLTVDPGERPGSPLSDSDIGVAAMISAETATIAIISANSKKDLCFMAKLTPLG
jgi:hypothetical protein